MKEYSILLLPMIFWFISGCETPTGGFERTNNKDPLSPAFRAGTITGLQASADTSGVITVRWTESDEIATRNVLEKSLGDSLNFTTIAELSPDILQFSDTSFEVRKNTYYRLSSYIAVAGNDDILLRRSEAVLKFGEIVNLANEFLSEENSLRLAWSTDVPFFTHFIISSENVLSEQQENSIKIPAEGIKNSFVDPLLDIDFKTRKYTVKGIIEHDGVGEAITEQKISFDVVSLFRPGYVDIDVLNEQDWKVSWEKPPFFATNIEVTRFSFEGDIVFNFPAETTSFIDSLIVDVSHGLETNQSRRYQLRFLTDTGASRGVTDDAAIEIRGAAFFRPGIDEIDPTSLNLKWFARGVDSNLIKEFIIERQHPFRPGRFEEIARVGGNTFQYTDINVNQSENYTYRIRTVTTEPEKATFFYSHRFELDYSYNTGMNYVTRMEINSEKRYLTTVSFRSGINNSILIQDIESRQQVAVITIPSQQISDFKISPDEESIYFSVPTEGAIYKADYPNGSNIVKIIDDANLNSVGVFHVDVSSDGSFIIGTGGRGFVKRWNLNTYETEFIYNNPNTPTTYLYKNIAISSDGAFIGGNDGRTYIMNAQDGAILHLFPWASPNMTDIQFSANGRYYSFVEDFERTRIYSTENWEHIHVIDSRRADFHPQNNIMVVLKYSGVFTYDLENFRIVDRISDERGVGPVPGMENAISFIDDNRIATVSGISTMQIWRRTESMGWRVVY
jgi:WD40 repeat protein